MLTNQIIKLICQRCIFDISFSVLSSTTPESLINTDVTGGSVYQCTWMFKCLNLSRSLNQMFVKGAQTVRLLFMRLRDASARLFGDSEKNALRILESVYTVAVTK